MREVNRKVSGIAVVLMAVAMLSTPFIGAVLAGYGGKNVVAVEWEVQIWPLRPPSEDMRTKIIEKEAGNMIVGKNIYTIGVPPLVDNVNLPPTPSGPPPFTPEWDDYPAGGIRLTITEGEDSYTLVGSFEKVFLWVVNPNRGGMLENSRWSFEITDADENAPEGAVGSTMSGTLINVQGGNEDVLKSTKGTGIFEGAFLRGTQLVAAGAVFHPTNPGVYAIYSYSTGSGEIVFP